MLHPSREKIRSFQKALLAWYARNKRRFAWRMKKRTAFEILIAEIMLRKTDAAKVAQVYTSFIDRYPNPLVLSKADESNLRNEIRLLGIADRARLLRLLAQRLVNQNMGRVPRDFSTLTELPGVGPYTANAVLCFASGKNVALVDTNTIRVLGRVFSFRSKKLRARDDPGVWAFATSLVPAGKSISYNRAVLDLAALLCTYRNPHCPACPLRNICDYGRARLRSTVSGVLTASARA